jgi:hypothetical protein
LCAPAITGRPTLEPGGPFPCLHLRFTQAGNSVVPRRLLDSELAWRGWNALVAGGFAGFLFAAVYGTALLISGRATRKQQIPFGPFMIAGAFLAMLLS